MRFNKIITFSLLVASLGACKKELAIQPEQNVSDQVVFTSKAGAQSALLGVYSTAQILDVFGSLPQLIGDYQADNVEFVGSFPTLQEIRDFTTLSTNSNVQLIWQNHYRVILRANSIITRVPGITEIGFTDAEKKQMVAEAKFMRAITYFQLVNLFAQPFNCSNGSNLGVPLVLSEFTGTIEFPARSTVAQVHAQIKKDLDESIPDLLNVSQFTATSEKRGRATKGAARALLSRFHLYRGEWQLAADFANQIIIAPAADYALATNYGFYDALTAEDIFVSIMTTTDNSRTGSGGWAGYYRPTSATVPATGGGRGDAPFTTDLVNAYLQESGDRRLLLSDSATGADVVRRRFTLKYPDGVTNDDDAPLIRVTEMYLNRAEALAELNGVNQESITLINALRTRAGLTPWTLTTFTTKQAFINAILNERRKELAFEGHRRMDLLRRGLPLRSSGSTAAISKPCDAASPRVILPIPNREIEINPGLQGQQNPGY
jgi:hypothetical protein